MTPREILLELVAALNEAIAPLGDDTEIAGVRLDWSSAAGSIVKVQTERGRA